MIRFPNPGSDIEMAVRIFRDLYQVLREAPDFDLDDFTKAMIARSNVTSQGAVGEEALRRSTRKDRSRDPLYNQSKMYAELFRTLGWIQSTSSALRFAFSFLGQHVASAKDPKALVRECFIGLAYPNDVLNVKGGQSLRVFVAILRAMGACEGKLSRDEIIIGPMSIQDDRNPKLFAEMTESILKLRRTHSGVEDQLEDLENELGITHTTMGNYTRIPMATLVWTGWGEKESGYTHLTDFGRKELARIESYVDFRLSDFRKLPVEAQQPFARLTFHRMLGRSGFDVSPVHEEMNADAALVGKLVSTPTTEWLFSPFQQIARDELQKSFAREVKVSVAATQKGSGNQVLATSSRPSGEKTQKLLFEITSEGISNSAASQTIAETIRMLAKEFNNSTDAVVARLAVMYESANQDVFYPLIAELFRVLGFDCHKSRQGVNYERADAMIRDTGHSIPIEIKSPGEEMEISVKAVRQALENKIILLSRKSYPTTQDTTSLVVGYNRPNERSEVHELIDDVYSAFGFRIGVLDFRSLLTVAVSSVLTSKRVTVTDFRNLKGVFNVTHP